MPPERRSWKKRKGRHLKPRRRPFRKNICSCARATRLSLARTYHRAADGTPAASRKPPHPSLNAATTPIRIERSRDTPGAGPAGPNENASPSGQPCRALAQTGAPEHIRGPVPSRAPPSQEHRSFLMRTNATLLRAGLNEKLPFRPTPPCSRAGRSPERMRGSVPSRTPIFAGAPTLSCRRPPCSNGPSRRECIPFRLNPAVLLRRQAPKARGCVPSRARAPLAGAPIPSHATARHARTARPRHYKRKRHVRPQAAINPSPTPFTAADVRSETSSFS